MQKLLKLTTLLPLIIIAVIIIGGGLFIASQQDKQPNSQSNSQLKSVTENNEAAAHSDASSPEDSINVTLLSESQISEQLPNLERYPTDPKRIVAMEYSFLGDLMAVGLTPVGIADDNKPETIIPEFSEHLGAYTSVGSRYQPSLEAIADLKPDLIIADKERHAVIEDSLNQIAPAVILKSRGETYEENLQTAQLVGHLVHQDEKMTHAIESHLHHLGQIKAKLTATPMRDKSVQFAIISDKGMWLHGPSSYAGSLLTQLGIKSPIPNQTQQAYIPTSLEQLVAADPDWLLIGRYNDHTAFDDWKTSPLFQQLTAVKNNQVIEVDPNYWALNRSMQSAEHIANKVLEIAKSYQ